MRSRWRGLARYGAAFGILVATAVLVRFVPALAPERLLLFVLPVVAATLLGGPRLGGVAAFAGAGFALLFFAWQEERPAAAWAAALLTYLFVAASVIAGIHAMARATRRLHVALEESEVERESLEIAHDKQRMTTAAREHASGQHLAHEHAGRERAEAALRDTALQLRESQKMEAIGRLAGGIAHDFNNLLTVILSYTGLLLRRGVAACREEVLEIQRAATRASSLTHQLLAFSRRQVLQPRAVDLNAVVGSIREMIERLVGEAIHVEIRLTTVPPVVFCDPGPLEQVIMNLVVNARDAMPKGGTLSVATSVGDGWASVSVVDTGVGMGPETIEHIFEPFFTTKGPGKGTGLGLSMAYGIVEQSGGHIAVSSTPGEGSTFRIHLPLAEGPVVADPGNGARTGGDVEGPQAARGLEAPPSPGIILLVEDEASVRSSLELVLEEGGFPVVTAGGGAEALEICARLAKQIVLLVTDVRMAPMTGVELAREVSRQFSWIYVLFISGYTSDVLGQHGIVDEHVAFLPKPVVPSVLLAKVREMIHARGARSPGVSAMT